MCVCMCVCVWWGLVVKQRVLMVDCIIAVVRKVVGSTLTVDRAVFRDLILGL